MNNQNIKQNKNMIMSIIAVAIIIALVGGATYAYWTWRSNNNTAVSFRVSGGSMTIDGGGTINATKTLAPASCTNTTYAIQRKIKVTATNETANAMTGTIGLYVTKLSTSSGTLNSTNKASLKYALASITATQYSASSTWNGCSSGTGNFASVSQGNTITLLNNLSIPAANGATASTATFYYELYIWIDSQYSGTQTVGTTVGDALQDMDLTLVWTGSMTNET